LKVSIHQPQFMPWLPYFQKIEQSDVFIFLDTVDYQKNGLQNRNKIKTPNGEQWLTVPVLAKLGQKIKDVEIDNTQKWKKKHLNALTQNYSKAKHFNLLSETVDSFYNNNWENLSELNINFTTSMLEKLEISTKILKSSDLHSQGSSSDLILNLCKELGATKYLTGSGAENYLKFGDFKEEGIDIEYFDCGSIEPYAQTFQKIGFVANLSALDIFCNCGQDWRKYVTR